MSNRSKTFFLSYKYRLDKGYRFEIFKLLFNDKICTFAVLLDQIMNAYLINIK